MNFYNNTIYLRCHDSVYETLTFGHATVTSHDKLDVNRTERLAIKQHIH